ncbi:MAG: hypothetical protein CML13_01420 [Puniceicoccaceae bacterium]|nr:hypothetical protein [Puniceicoccaceae bacterium]|tara:strand:- start:174 stop:869 length:696 start_codon:yes stop_codon:yes gene_type:complete
MLNGFSQEKPPQIVDFHFKIFGIGKDNFQGLYYFTDGSPVALKFHKTYRSKNLYHYIGSEFFIIYVKNEQYNPKDPLSNEYIAIDQIQLGSPAKRSLLVFCASEKNRDGIDTERKFNILAIDDSLDHFSRNTIIILNTTSATLTGKVAKTRLSLPTGASDPISYETSTGSKKGTPIVFALETDNGPKLVMSNDIKLPNDRRILMILEQPRRKGSLRLSARILSESIFEQVQ